MIKKYWDAIHFGRFKSQWRNDPPADLDADRVAIGKTLFYESYLAMFTGRLDIGHFALFEAFFIAAFGLFNGYALHRVTQDPGYGVEELSLHRIELE